MATPQKAYPGLEFSLLESNDLTQVNGMKHLIVDYLNTFPESWLVNGLVDFYMSTNSSRALSILSSLREPHHKHLFDNMHDYMKVDQKLQTLTLLGHVIRKQPPWLHKIVCTHPLLSTILKCLKTSSDITLLMNGSLVITTLLPMVPSLVGSHLGQVFDVFWRMASLVTKNSGNLPDVHLVHLHVAAYHLFHYLYGMFPCNFVAYLRHSASKDENALVTKNTILPFLERVRMHPGLVTSDKPVEISKTKWYRKEVHDIVMECAKHSLDAAEGTSDAQGPLYYFEKNRRSLDQLYRKFDGGFQSGHKESQSVLAHTLNQEAFWSPSSRCDLKSPPPSRRISQETKHPTSQVNSVEVTPVTTPREKQKCSLETSKAKRSDSAPVSAKYKLEFSTHSVKEADTKRRNYVTKRLQNVQSGTITATSPTYLGDNYQQLSAPVTPLKKDSSPAPWDGRASAQTEAEILKASKKVVHSGENVKQEAVTANSVITVNNLPDVIQKLSEHQQIDLEDNALGEYDEEVSGLVSYVGLINPADHIADYSAHASAELDSSLSELFLFQPGDQLSFSNTGDQLSHLLTSESTTDASKSVAKTTADTKLTNGSAGIDVQSSRSSELGKLTRERRRTGENRTISDTDEEAEELDGFRTRESVANFMRNVNRIRFYSQCPETIESLGDASLHKHSRTTDRPLSRSSSCPMLSAKTVSVESASEREEPEKKGPMPCLLCQQVSSSISAVTCIQPSSSSAAFSPVVAAPAISATSSDAGPSATCSESTRVTKMIYARPLMSTAKDFTGKQFPFYTTLPPPELLDRHIQLATDVHSKDLERLMITSQSDTDWTHFGGSPPADEVKILRGQLLLLHNQLMFERHRRDLHGQRNRRLLGKAIQSVVMEEKSNAMKDQLQLQEQEIFNLQHELAQVREKLQQLKQKKEEEQALKQMELQAYIQQKDHYFEGMKENEDEIKTKNGQIIQLSQLLQHTQASLFASEKNLERIQEEVRQNRELKEKVIQLGKELLLAGEVERKYRDQLYLIGSGTCTGIPDSTVESYSREISSLKARVRHLESQHESKKSRLADLETVLGKKDLIIAEQKRSLEHSKNLDMGQIQALETKYKSMKLIAQGLESHVMELYGCLDAQSKKPVGDTATSLTPPLLGGQGEHRHRLHRSNTVPARATSVTSPQDHKIPVAAEGGNTKQREASKSGPSSFALPTKCTAEQESLRNKDLGLDDK